MVCHVVDNARWTLIVDRGIDIFSHGASKHHRELARRTIDRDELICNAI